MKKLLLNLLLITLFLFIGISCKKTYFVGNENLIDNTQDSEKISDDAIVNNDVALLNDRITFAYDTTHTFVDTSAIDEKSLLTKSTMNSSITIQLIAQLAPPMFNQEVLQASHIRIVNGYAYIAYNTQGPRYLGGADIVNISTATNPQLISNIIFDGKDVSSIDVEPKGSGNNNFVWLAEAEENNPDLATPALVERYVLNSSNQFKAINDPKQFYDLPGYVGTDVKYRSEKIYVTSGTGGGLTILNNGMHMSNYYPFDNARSVDANSQYVIALGGNPGHLFNPGVWNKLIGGATDPEAKSMVRLYTNSAAKCNYNFALAALGEDGLKCYNIASSTPEIAVSTLPRPTIPAGGDSWNYVTNAVSISNGWVYIANGASGLDIAKLNTTTGKLTWLGNINLGSSVNFVEASCDYVFVATGLGGLKILKVKEN